MKVFSLLCVVVVVLSAPIEDTNTNNNILAVESQHEQEEQVVAVEQAAAGDEEEQEYPAEMYMTSWWVLWHQHFNDLTEARVATTPLDFLSISASLSDNNNTNNNTVDNTTTTTTTTTATTPQSNSAQNLTPEEQMARIQQLQDSMSDRLHNYWDFLSNSTRANLPYPAARNVEMHSDGIFNNALTATVEWDHPNDEEFRVQGFWFRFSSDCSDLGRLEPDMPPVHMCQMDPLMERYQTTVGPVRVPEGAQCILLYTIDKLGQPFPNPVPLLLPQFRYPKPVFEISTHCKKGWEGCFNVNSNGTSCESIMGQRCCGLKTCMGCEECSQIRNLETEVPRPRLYAPSEPCEDRFDRQGFTAKFGFNCQSALRWGLMNCEADSDFRLCFRTCALCNPLLYPKTGARPANQQLGFPAVALPSPADAAAIAQYQQQQQP